MRGKGSYAPFLPGGLDAGAVTADGEFASRDQEEDQEGEEEEGWKTRAPGLKRGLALEGGKCTTTHSPPVLTSSQPMSS